MKLFRIEGMNDSSVEEFFGHILRLVAESDRRINDANKKVAKCMLSRFKFASSAIKIMNTASMTDFDISLESKQN